jgi:predicted lipid-binding transport protein (Tim44 family)
MSRLRFFFGVTAVALVAALVLASAADARPGSGGSFGSRGTRTYTAPAPTRTAPNTAAPMERSVTQPTRPGVTQPAPAGGGFFGRPGFVGGLFAGFLGAGLLGMLFGGGLFGGLGGLASILGLILQIALIVIVARLIWALWQRRNAPATAGGPSLQDVTPSARSALGGLGGSFGGSGSGAAAPVNIEPADYDAFERLLKDVTLAYGASDVSRLRTLATPEMVSYFADDLARYAGRGLTNEVGDITLEQGDLSEAWREGEDEYATVAMRYRLKDAWVDAAGRVVEGSREPQEVTELWTFRRPRGGHWILSAIQQAS